MFEKMAARARARAEERARLRAGQAMERLRVALPKHVELEAVPQGVRILGRGLRRRFALDPALRWLGAVLK